MSKGEPLERDQPVLPKGEFDADYNKVPEQSAFQSEAWSQPTGDSRGVTIPPGTQVEVDGRPISSDRTIIIQNAETVNIYNGYGRDRDPVVARVEDNSDYINDNYPVRYDAPHGRVGNQPYYNPHTYSEMRRNYDRPQVVINADIGTRQYGPYDRYDRNDRYDRHPRFEFGHNRRYPGTPPFFPPNDGGPRISIGIGNHRGGGIRIGDLDIGGRIVFGGNNRGFDGYDPCYRQPWDQPRLDIFANINTGRDDRNDGRDGRDFRHNRRDETRDFRRDIRPTPTDRPTNFNGDRQSQRIAENRHRFEENRREHARRWST